MSVSEHMVCNQCGNENQDRFSCWTDRYLPGDQDLSIVKCLECGVMRRCDAKSSEQANLSNDLVALMRSDSVLRTVLDERGLAADDGPDGLTIEIGLSADAGERAMMTLVPGPRSGIVTVERTPSGARIRIVCERFIDAKIVRDKPAPRVARVTWGSVETVHERSERLRLVSCGRSVTFDVECWDDAQAEDQAEILDAVMRAITTTARETPEGVRDMGSGQQFVRLDHREAKGRPICVFSREVSGFGEFRGGIYYHADLTIDEARKFVVALGSAIERAEADDRKDPDAVEQR